MLVLLCKMYIRSHKEYCVQVWNPYLAKDIDVIEKVQRRATKCLQGLSQLSYEDCLKKLDLYSLYCRRQRGDLIEVYKILNGYYNMDSSTFFTLSNATITRDHQFKLFKVRSRLLVRHHFFTNRIVNHWNSLPNSVVTAPTVATFKQRLDDLWRIWVHSKASGLALAN